MGMCCSPGYGFQGTPKSIDVGQALYMSVISPPFYGGGQGGKWVKMNITFIFSIGNPGGALEKEIGLTTEELCMCVMLLCTFLCRDCMTVT